MSSPRFASATEARQNNFFSRRHKTAEPHLDQKEKNRQESEAKHSGAIARMGQHMKGKSPEAIERRKARTGA